MNTPRTIAVDYVNVHGDAVFVPQTLKKAAAPKRQAPERFHKGFRVEGHPPGAMEMARDFAVAARSAWLALSAEEQSDRRSKGNREPKEWDEVRWLAKTKLKPVRSKPYDLHAAALECAALATKAGWLSVSVREIKKGDEDAA